MNEYILITGATTGIGYEMALQLAQKKFNLILVARTLEKLEMMQENLSTRYEIEVQYISVDLSDPNNAVDVFNQVQSNNWRVSHLVNNAGFGDYGSFLETSLEKELAMIHLNVSSLVILTKLFAQEMAVFKSGRIMNVASLLAFIPLPYYSVYSATKSFVLAFSETIASEMEGTGVVITALCPGTVETPFHTSEMRKTNAMNANKPMSASVVAKSGVELLLLGQGKKVVGLNNWFISKLPMVTPDGIMTKIKKNLASIKS